MYESIKRGLLVMLDNGVPDIDHSTTASFDQCHFISSHIFEEKPSKKFSALFDDRRENCIPSSPFT